MLTPLIMPSVMIAEPELFEIIPENIFEPFFEELGNFFNNYVITPIYDFFSWLGSQLWNAILYVIDEFLEAFEWFLNQIRGYLKYAIMIVISWLMISRALKSEKLSILGKIATTIIAPIVGAITAEMLDAIIPPAVTLPRIRPVLIPPEVYEEYYHQQYVDEIVNVISPLSVSEEKYHEQYTDEVVKIINNIFIIERFNHEHYTNETIITGLTISVLESYEHIQYIYESVGVITGLVLYPEYQHEQYVNEYVTVA